MLSSLRRRVERREDDGFTLIELMVVILIIAILLAIAIPTFLGARSRAQDRAAQSSLRNALTAADTSYANVNSYLKATDATAGTAGDLASVEPALTFCGVTANCGPTSGKVSSSTGPNEISIALAAGGGTYGSATLAQTDPASTDSPQIWAAAAKSKSNQCFAVVTVKVPDSSGTGSGSTSLPSGVAGTYYTQWQPASGSGCSPASVGSSAKWLSSWT